MTLYVQTASNTTLELEDQHLGKGGEGHVHRIIRPANYAQQCVKLYLNDTIAQVREHKVHYMIAHPLKSAPGLGSYAICWPQEAVFHNHRFAGFVMPMADARSEELYELCTLSPHATLHPVWAQKYNRASSAGFTARMKLCVNIAIAVHSVHASGEYVFVDLKPNNFRITDDGKVFLIDLDSLQVQPQQGSARCFHAQVCTPDHAPPEAAGTDLKVTVINRSWDCFSLAVVFYELLFGLHPFAGSFKSATTIEEAIQQGLFVYGQHQHQIIKRPPTHTTFERMPAALQQLFLAAFDRGHRDPRCRPLPADWGRALDEVIKQGVLITPVVHHPPQPPASQRSPAAPPYLPGSAPAPIRRPQQFVKAFLVVALLIASFVGITRAPSRSASSAAPTAMAASTAPAATELVADHTPAQAQAQADVSPQGAVGAGFSRIQLQDVNLRQYPGSNQPITAILPRGVEVEVLGEALEAEGNVWARVRYGGEQGWVNTRYLTPAESAPLARGGRAIVQGVAPDRLLVRADPDQRGAIVDRLSEGAEVSLRELRSANGRDWWLVEIDQTVGWVDAGYLYILQS